MEKYSEMKKRHQREISQFPLGAAFTGEQFSEMMKKFGLTSADKDQICNLGAGLYCKKDDMEDFKVMMRRHRKEVKDAMMDKSYGEDFAYHAFLHEFNNYECGYTGEFEVGIAALYLTHEEIEKVRWLKNAYDKAKKVAMDCM